MHVTPTPEDWTEPTLSEVASSWLLESQATSEHDTTQLIAALDELERKRLAIEALLDAELLGLCLV